MKLLFLFEKKVALILEDGEFDDGVMGGKTARSGRFAGSLRRFLMREHLGLLGEDKNKGDEAVRDCTSKEFFQGVWGATAEENTKVSARQACSRSIKSESRFH